ncbi:serine aminopeptidase domain-containing protein [Hymenobacter metallicola]|uniref:Alpha/beta hydrolase n=1 Tax=Hymenobacter metallicola TaxID=2563114 RepID=A0A4Z0QIA5_9BACT|nr:alpha/beta hydrolase [Hymenobacter metallicola]TGE29216.1 alpha/beta hydrolase [Hymenobacter metallicola]
MKAVLALGLLALTASCRPHSAPFARGPRQETIAPVLPAARTTTLSLFDSARRRSVPVVLYWPATNKKATLALLSHGYGGQNTAYSFLANQLAAAGYLVASIQHELPTDEPLPTTGNPRLVRRPTWERGVQNQLFVRQQLHRLYPRLDVNHLLLLGHSNGGDMAMLLAQEHPQLVDKVISLDNRRMPLPRIRRPRILTIRSSDQVADAGVLPSAAEQAALGMLVVQLPATLHNDMWDGATEAQKQEIRAVVAKFLRR